MGPVNWLAVVLAALLAAAIGFVWYGPLFRGQKPRPWALLALLVPAAMIGHNFARVGAETLAAKPWLYWMMSGGFALAIIAPALFVTLARHGIGARDRLVDCGYWIVAFLAMGTVFWALA